MLRPSFMLLMLLAVLPASAAEPVRIPIVKGMVEVAANYTKKGDIEQIMTITDATQEYVDFSDRFRESKDGKQKIETRVRRVRRVDLAASNKMNWVFQPGDALMFPGATLSHVSAVTLNQLKTQTKVPMVIGTLIRDDNMTAFDELADDFPAFSSIASGRKYFRGNFERVGKTTVPIRILLNGKSVSLPTVHAKGLFTVAGDSTNVEIWVLDDASNPMILRIGGDGGNRHTIRIDYPSKQPQAAALQIALASGACRAELNGIYFDFAKATLLPQSAPALRAVADLMTKNPGWNLRIEGHTDNVGSASYNLDLSKRRAAAVTAALTTQYKLQATRLNANGFGATKPVAKNDTLEGRAANRRVELARTCP